MGGGKGKGKGEGTTNILIGRVLRVICNVKQRIEHEKR